MSYYSFIASDKKLPELSIGIKDEGYRIIIEDESHTLNIFTDEKNCCTEPFTSKNEIMGVEIGLNFKSIENDLLDYLKKVMESNDTIELFSTWMGEVGDVEKRAKDIKELSVDDLKWIFGSDIYTGPKSLKIYKLSRGKK